MHLLICTALSFSFSIYSCRREHERRLRAYRFPCPGDSAQFFGAQPLCRAQWPEFKGSSRGHGYVCAGRNGPAAEGWERILSHYHGCTVSIGCQMMSDASMAQTWLVTQGVEKTPTFPNLKVWISHLLLPPLLFLTLLWSHHAVAWSSAAAFWEWTETFDGASCSLCHRLQGLDSNNPLPLFAPVPPCSSLLAFSQTDSSLDCRTASSILP